MILAIFLLVDLLMCFGIVLLFTPANARARNG